MRYFIPFFIMGFSGCAAREYGEAVLDIAPALVTDGIAAYSTGGISAVVVSTVGTIGAVILAVYEARRAKKAESKVCDLEASLNSKPLKSVAKDQSDG